jgi:hypothetical protein
MKDRGGRQGRHPRLGPLHNDERLHGPGCNGPQRSTRDDVDQHGGVARPTEVGAPRGSHPCIRALPALRKGRHHPCGVRAPEPQADRHPAAPNLCSRTPPTHTIRTPSESTCRRPRAGQGGLPREGQRSPIPGPAPWLDQPRAATHSGSRAAGGPLARFSTSTIRTCVVANAKPLLAPKSSSRKGPAP